MLGLLVGVIVFDRGRTGVMTIAAAATTAIVPTGEAKLHAAAPEDRDGGPCGQHRWQCPGCENNF